MACSNTTATTTGSPLTHLNKTLESVYTLHACVCWRAVYRVYVKHSARALHKSRKEHTPELQHVVARFFSKTHIFALYSCCKSRFQEGRAERHVRKMCFVERKTFATSSRSTKTSIPVIIDVYCGKLPYHSYGLTY
jgi:hypothetical protein